MQKKIITISIILFICAVIIFTIYKVDSINQTEKRMLETAEDLMNTIHKGAYYDEIKSYVKKEDGKELSNQQVYNFLLNTELYRGTFINTKEPIFTYSTTVDFFNTNKGTIIITYKALNGDTITNKLQYTNTGTNEYFITNKYNKSNKSLKEYPIAKDLANGNEINYSEDELENKFYTYKYIQDENNNLYLEAIKESEEDLKISMDNMIKNNFKDKKDEKKYEWNEDYSVISMYYNSTEELSLIEKLHISSVSLSFATIQALKGNSDWHVTINYYDYNSKELLKSEIIR